MSRQVEFIVNSHPRYNRRHHTPKGFRNIWDEHPPSFSFFTALRWVIGHALQRKENIPPPVRSVDPSLLAQPPSQFRIVWLGHSSLLIQTPALTILVDPVFCDRASPFPFAGPKRLAALPITIDDLPRIDIILLSHNHYDHCDKSALRVLFKQYDPVVLVPLGVKNLVEGWGANRAVELDWWQYVDVEGMRFHATPARHFSGRSLWDRNQSLWLSWYLEGLNDDTRIYFGGDTAYATHFSEIREECGAPQVALLPVGAYMPRWFMESVHTDPAQAVQGFLDLQAEHLIPIHWGVFDLADETISEPMELTRKCCREAGFQGVLHELPIGGIFSL